MADAHTHGHTRETDLYFSQQEWERLQADDRHAGGVVIALMTAIFTIGLVLYFTICMIVW